MSAKLSTLFVVAITFGLMFGLAPSPAFAQEGGGSSKANLDLPFDAAGQQEEEEEAPEIVIFYGQQFEGEGIFFCLDRSSSMNAERMKRLKQEVLKNIMQFSERVQFGIVFFDAGIKKFPASTRPAEATPAMKAGANAWVNSMQTGSGSCYKEGIFAALDFANLSTVKRKVVIVAGDGEPYCGGTVNREQALGAVRARNTTGVKINTICTYCVEENFLKSLAAQNSGTYTKV